MKTTLNIAAFAIAAWICLCFGQMLIAQDQMGFSKPEPQHEFLKKFVGRWESKAEIPASPGQPAMTCTGVMEAKMLGNLWLIAEHENSMMGTKVNAVLTLGYDAETKKYVGTWVDSAMNHLWHYEGTVEGDKITLNAKGPNFISAGEEAEFQDIYTFKSADLVEIESRMKAKDGEWTTFMKGTSKRSK